MVGAAEAIVAPAGLPNVRRLSRNAESSSDDRFALSMRDAANVNNKLTPEDYGMVLLARGAPWIINKDTELPPPSLFNSPTGEWGVTYFRQNNNATFLVAKTFNEAGEAISQDEFLVFDLGRYAAILAAGVYINRAVGISNEQFAIVYRSQKRYQLNLQVQAMTGLPIVCSTTINANPNTASGYLCDFDIVPVVSNNGTKIAVITTWNEDDLYKDYKKATKSILDIYIQLYNINCIQIASINTPIATNAVISQVNNLDGDAGFYQSGLSLPITNQNNILFAYLSTFHLLEESYKTYLIYFDANTNNFTVNNGPIVYESNTGFYIQRLTYVNLDQFNNVVNCLDRSIAQRTQCLINSRSSKVINVGFDSTDLLLKTIFFSDNSALLFNTDQQYIYATYMQIEKYMDNITHQEKYVRYTMPSVLSPIQGSNLFESLIFDAIPLTKTNFVFMYAVARKFSNDAYKLDIYYKISSASLTFDKSGRSTFNYTEGQITPIYGISVSVMYNSAITITAALSSEFGIQSIASSLTAVSSIVL